MVILALKRKFLYLCAKNRLIMIKLRIKECCKEHGVKLETLANRLGLAQPTTLSQQIKRNKFGIDRLEDIASIIGCDEVELFDGYQKEDKKSDFASYIRYKGIHYTADTIDEFLDQVEEIKLIAK